jgi:hypothetical protein
VIGFAEVNGVGAVDQELLATHPRLEFAELAADQAERTPGSQAARIVRGGVAAKLLANPLERAE